MLKIPSLILRFVVIFIASFLSLVCSAKVAEPYKPLIFNLVHLDGKSSCLVAMHHIAIVPAVETTEIVKCKRRARAIVVEANPFGTDTFSLNRYKILGEEFSAERLSKSTFQKILPAMLIAGYSHQEFDFFVSLHPVALYRALLSPKAFSAKQAFYPNLDLRMIKSAHEKGLKIIEIEGTTRFIKMELEFSIEKLDSLISIICDLYLDPVKLKKLERLIMSYGENLNAQPNIDTALNYKKYFNTELFGLPLYTVAKDVEDRNPYMVKKMIEAMKINGETLIFVGADHVGGPNGILVLLKKAGVKIQRIQ